MRRLWSVLGNLGLTARKGGNARTIKKIINPVVVETRSHETLPIRADCYMTAVRYEFSEFYASQIKALSANPAFPHLPSLKTLQNLTKIQADPLLAEDETSRPEAISQLTFQIATDNDLIDNSPELVSDSPPILQKCDSLSSTLCRCSLCLLWLPRSDGHHHVVHLHLNLHHRFLYHRLRLQNIVILFVIKRLVLLE
ncbi:hypothetical protein JOM56_010380 [Amanita muscaria]